MSYLYEFDGIWWSFEDEMDEMDEISWTNDFVFLSEKKVNCFSENNHDNYEIPY